MESPPAEVPSGFAPISPSSPEAFHNLRSAGSGLRAVVVRRAGRGARIGWTRRCSRIASLTRFSVSAGNGAPSKIARW